MIEIFTGDAFLCSPFGYIGCMISARALMTLMVLSSGGYLFLPGGQGVIFPFSVLFGLQFALYFGLILQIRKGGKIPLVEILLTALICRIILWSSAPVLENDYWRYLWDGRVLAHGINPFKFSPDNPALDFLTAPYRDLIAWRQFPTLYPPLSQLLFTALHFIRPDSVLALKVTFTLFDLATGVVLLNWFKNREIRVEWSLLYFLNPLLLKEISNSAHLDSLPMFLTLFSLYFMCGGRTSPFRSAIAWTMLALGVASKLYPLVLVPLYLAIDHRWRRHLILFTSVLILIYLPFISAGTLLFSGTAAYGKHWIFNAGVFQVTTLALNSILQLFDSFTSDPDLREALLRHYPAKILLGIIYLAYVFRLSRRLQSRDALPAASLRALGALLLLSPAVDPWYVLWILPLACLEGNMLWLVFSFLILASYTWWVFPDQAFWFRGAEYFIFFGLAWVYRRGMDLRGVNG